MNTIQEIQNYQAGLHIANAYTQGLVKGWDANIAREAFKVVSGMTNSLGSPIFKPLGIDTTSYLGKKMRLWDVTRKILGKDTPNYPQQIGDCFVAGTKVLMADGTEKNIEDVKVDEMVLNHLNQPRRVTDLVRKKYTGEMVTIKAKGWHRSLTATATHQAMYLPCIDYRFHLSEFGTKPFGKYEESDYVLLNYGRTEENKEDKCFDIATMVDGLEVEASRVRPGKGKWIKRFVVANEDFGRLIGLYLAEGGVDDKQHTITFSFCSDERDLIEDTKSLLAGIFGVEGVEHDPKASVTCVIACSVVVARFLKQLMPGNVYDKNVPDCFFSARHTVRKAVIKGWMDGDGHLSKELNRMTGVSASVPIIDGISRLALSLKISPRTLTRHKEKHQRVPSLQCDFYGTAIKDIYPSSGPPNRPIRNVHLEKTPFGFARKLKSVTRTYVEEHDVFCVTVDGEHTLIVNGFSQKNCVSFGGKNAAEYLTCTDMLIRGVREKFRPIFPPYYYGTSRVQIGGQRDHSDGSSGAWLAAAIVKYGTLFSDETGVPAYSGSIAKSWGYSGPPENFIPIAQKYLVKSAAQINSWDELVTAICNGYPCSTASNVGYNMQASSDGFHHRAGAWGHQMCTLADTMIASSTPKNIDEVQIGDEVYGDDGKLHKVTQVFKRKHTGKMVKLSCYGTLPLSLTGNHPVLVAREEKPGAVYAYHQLDNVGVAAATTKKILHWVNAEDVKVGDKLVSTGNNYDTNTIIPKWQDARNTSTTVPGDLFVDVEQDNTNLYRPVRKVEQIDHDGFVYNLEVEDCHTYIANGLVVHNCFIGVGSAPEDYAIILNNWGDVHGQLKDFDDSSDLPVGVLRVRRKDAEAHIDAGETYAWSQFDGFPEQPVDKLLFKVVG